MVAEIIKPQYADDSIGMVEPIAIEVRMRASGTPLSNLAKIGFHMKGETHMQPPRITQIIVIESALKACDTIHADKNVR